MRTEEEAREISKEEFTAVKRRIQVNAKASRMKWYYEPGNGLWARNPIVKDIGTCGFGL